MSQFFVAFAIFSCLLGSDEKAATKSPEPRIVLRISHEFVAKLVNQEVENAAPVDRILFGAHVTGTATTSGKVVLLPAENEREASFNVRFHGTIFTKTISQRKGVTVSSSGTTFFAATKRIQFDGHAFIAGPTEIQATRTSATDGISVPRGIASGIVRSAAQKQVRRLQPQGDEIAINEGKSAIVAEFDKQMDRAVRDLNDAVPFDDIVNTYLPNAKNLEMHFASSKNHLLAAVGQPDAKFPRLPTAVAGKRAPVEICIQYTKQTEIAQKLTDRWKAVSQVIQSLTLSAPDSNKEKVQGIAFTVHGEWLVFKIGETLALKLLDDE